MPPGLHQVEFSPIRDVAYTFITRDLGLTAAPIENFALVSPERFAEVSQMQGQDVGGEYDIATDTAVLVQARDDQNPLTTATRNVCAAVHEIAHSVNPSRDTKHHLFFREALTGLTELFYLGRRADLGNYQPATGFVLRRAGVQVWLPPQARYLDRREAVGKPQHGAKGGCTSQGVVAALGIMAALRDGCLTPMNVVKMSNGKSMAGYFAMRYALNKAKPGLADEIERFPESTEGIIQATAHIIGHVQS